MAAALASVAVIVAACGGDGAGAGTRALAPSSGFCIPAAPLGASAGDSWTISGPFHATANYPGKVPANAAELSTTFTIEAIETSTFAEDGESEPVEYPVVRGRFRNVVRDPEGGVVDTGEGEVRGVAVAVRNLSPVLAPDWGCHELAWEDGWPADTETAVREETLPSGVEAVVFSVTQPLDVPDQEIEATSESYYAYERRTGRLVMRDTRTAGTVEGEPFSMELVQRFTPP